MNKAQKHPFILARVGRFSLLLAAILMLFVVRPFIEGYVGIEILMIIFLSLILFSAIFAVSETRLQSIIALILGLAAVTIKWWAYFSQIPGLDFLEKILGGIFMTYAAAIMLSHLFKQKEVTVDVIIGGICVYFLIGLMWAFIFYALEMAAPGSFHLADDAAANDAEFTYFSFVTLTTLGYGDTTPLTTPARNLVVVEAVMGQLYLAILVARLVGLHIAHASKE
jgi:hypothetical protein